MVITFNDKKLEKLANDPRKALKDLGKPRFDKFTLRLDQLRAAHSLEDLRYALGRYHELTTTRKGEWACDLDQPYRLIFVPHEDPIPLDAGGNYDWTAIRGVAIVEITNYHKEK